MRRIRFNQTLLQGQANENSRKELAQANKAYRRYSYSKESANEWAPILYQAYINRESYFIDADSFKCSHHTMHMKASDALKYLAEVEDPATWIPIKAALSICKVGEEFGEHRRYGVEIKPKTWNGIRSKSVLEQIQQKTITVLEAAKRMVSDGTGTSDVRVTISKGAGAPTTVKPKATPEWRRELNKWLTLGSEGSIWQWPPEEAVQGEEIFQSDDKVWIQEQIKLYSPSSEIVTFGTKVVRVIK